MVYVQAARKTAAYMLVAAVLAFGVVTLITQDLSSDATGDVVSPAAQVGGADWLTFALGIFVGVLALGTIASLVWLEGRREE